MNSLNSKKTLLILLMVCYFPFFVVGQQPKLVVGIIIDQMRFDCLQRYAQTIGQNGFLRLINGGAYCTNASYSHLITESAPAVATISTGATPSSHGIIADQWFLRLQHKMLQCTDDDAYQPVGSMSNSGKASPKWLLGTTLGDELRLSNFKMSKVFSISIKNSTAILASGHVANAAYWFDDVAGKFITSSFYQPVLPQWLIDFNNKLLPDQYLRSGWHTLLNLDQYSASLPDNSFYENGLEGKITFPYNLEKLSQSKQYKLLKYTPYANALVAQMAIATIEGEQLGKDNYTDLLMVNFSSTGFVQDIYGIRSVEAQDTYIRLDLEIANLLTELDQRVGVGNYTVFLTADRGACDSPSLRNDFGIPGNQLSATNFITLLNTYLHALYGQHNMVEQYCNRQIYLNHSIIDNNRLPLDEVQTKTAQFLVQYPGIDNAAPGCAFLLNSYNSGFWQKAQNSYNLARSGDVLINLEPGWQEVSQGVNPSLSSQNSPYSSETHVPLMFYGRGIAKRKINQPVDITGIAPTIAVLLGINSPDYATGQPIGEVLDNNK